MSPSIPELTTSEEWVADVEIDRRPPTQPQRRALRSGEPVPVYVTFGRALPAAVLESTTCLISTARVLLVWVCIRYERRRDDA